MLSLPTLAAIAALLYGTGRVAYNLLFHPLARFPGPQLAAATAWYETYFDLLQAPGNGGRFPWELDRLHAVYGPIVRIAPNEVHIDDPSWYGVFKPGGAAKRDKNAARPLNPFALGTFSTITHDVHRPRKATLLPFYSKRNVARHMPALREQVDELCDFVRRHAERGEPVRMDAAYLGFTLDVICRIALGLAENVLGTPGKAAAWKETMTGAFETFPVQVNFPWLIRCLIKLPQAINDALSPSFVLYGRLRRRILEQAVTIAREHEALEAKPGAEQEDQEERSRATVFHAILNSDLPPAEKSLGRLHQEGLETIAAGTETSSRALTWATYNVLSTPGLQEKLRAEVRTVITETTSEPELSKLESLPLLNAILKETLRTTPLVVTRASYTAPGQTLRYGDWEIPPGAAFSTNNTYVLRNPAVFADPLVFRPERWLAEDTKQLDRAFVAFGKGARICSGMNLAWAEMRLALSTIFARFELELFDVDRARDLEPRRDCLMAMPSKESKGMRVKVVKVL